MIHRFETTLHIPLSRDEVLGFFAEAGNLQKVTPAELCFKILTPLPLEMAVGARIDYRLRLFGVAFDWQTLISRWEPPHCFVDEQLKGPYRRWVHTHRFEAVEGGTRMHDLVEYQLPFPPAGVLALPLVKLQLARIFRFRQQAIRRELLGPAAEESGS